MSLTRREFVVLGGAAYAGLVLGACSRGTSEVGARSKEVESAEAKRRSPNASVRELDLAAAPTTVDLAGISAATWAYNRSVPGPELRIRAGDVVRARFTNQLPEPTTVHWHGIALRNDMDGAAGVTQDPVAPGASFTYEFTAPDP